MICKVTSGLLFLLKLVCKDTPAPWYFCIKLLKMKKVLVINSSANAVNSNSRKLTEVFTGHLKNICTPIINYRELGNADVPHINSNWIAAAFKPEAARSYEEKDALKTSDTYIAELKAADVIVIGVPMYNWSIPSALKAYIDQIVRVNQTFRPDRVKMPNPYVGLLENKKLFLLLSQGEEGYEEGGYNAHMNFQTNYLKMVFNIIGIKDIYVVAGTGASVDREKFKKSIAIAHQAIKDIMDRELT
jgi:FMN-dependent NADH-azoreductase